VTGSPPGAELAEVRSWAVAWTPGIRSC